MNALSLPGGRVYITRGLYAELVRDDLLAAVLAHEMAHLTSGDHFKPPCGSLTEALRRELSADAGAASLLQAAGISPGALCTVVMITERAQPPGWAGIRVAAVGQLARR